MPSLGLALGLPFRQNNGGAETIPTTPTGLIATAGNQQIDLSWDAQPDADTFTIYYGITDTFGSAVELANSIIGTSFVHDSGESIVAGERYHYWIQAVNGAGSSSFSSSALARSFVTIGASETLNLTTPSGSFTIGTVLFSTTSPPSDYAIAYGAVTYFWDTVNWLNGDTFEPADSTPISGAFSLQSTGTGWTFWNTEP